MIIGVLEVNIALFEAMSLKDKRRVVKSLKDRIANRFNVSIAEVDHQDVIRSATLAAVMVANEKRFVESALSKIVDLVRSVPQVSLVDYTIEMR